MRRRELVLRLAMDNAGASDGLQRHQLGNGFELSDGARTDGLKMKWRLRLYPNCSPRACTTGRHPADASLVYLWDFENKIVGNFFGPDAHIKPCS